MAKKKDKKDNKGKKAAALAVTAAAAVVSPEAAEVVVQKTEAPAPIGPTAVEVPEPARFEYSKPRPLKTIGDLLRGALGVDQQAPPGIQSDGPGTDRA